MLTSVEAWPKPLVRSPAGEPFSVIVCAVPKPNAPGLCCWQLGHCPLPSVHCDEAVHALAAWSQVPAGGPGQQGNGLAAETHGMLWGHDACAVGAPPKQSVPFPSMSGEE